MENHVATIEQLNETVKRGDLVQLVCAEETRHIECISRIAERIAARIPKVRLVLLAGPSSAGKSTTAHRLCTRLRENALSPMCLSTDDYFVGDARNPRNPDGSFDYETIEAVDRSRLAADLFALFSGESVRLRKFDFLKKDGFDAETPVTLGADGVVVLEGIHALNPLLTEAIDEAVKFRVYINTFTCPEPDNGTPFFAEDLRLVRRIVRDCCYRNASPSDTIRRWPSVEAGEQRWINPYRRLADAVFNTSLDYELSVLKPFIEDLLLGVPPEEPEHREAERLSSVISSVMEAPSDGIPSNSILREAIGGSSIEY